MALPTKTELKAYLRIQTTAEDTLLDALLARATALIEAHLGRPITAAARTFVDEAETGVAYGQVTTLLIPVTPVLLTGTPPTIVDGEGTTLSSTTDYRLPADQWSGLIRARDGIVFNVRPYTITATVGLSAATDYATRIEPVIGAALIDLAADLWHRRNPAAQAEGAGGGVYTQFAQVGIPPRVAEMLAPFTVVRVV
jgi:NAD(P)H-dependent FMN reductase